MLSKLVAGVVFSNIVNYANNTKSPGGGQGSSKSEKKSCLNFEESMINWW